MKKKLIKSFFFFLFLFAFFHDGNLLSQAGDIVPLPESAFRSLWQFQFTYESSGARNVLGYKNVNLPSSANSDGEIRLRSDEVFNCDGIASSNNITGCAYSSQDLQTFKVYFPPSSKSQEVGFSKSQGSSSSAIVLMRFNEPPQGTYDQQAIIDGAGVYGRSGEGTFTKTTGKDHVLLIGTTGLYTFFRDGTPDNFSGGWLYVRIIPSATLYTLYYGGYADYTQYKSWYDAMTATNSWLSNGDPGAMNPISSLVGDLNQDRKVDIFDYNIFLPEFGKNQAGNLADLDKNGKVDIFDYNLFLSNFGKTG